MRRGHFASGLVLAMIGILLLYVGNAVIPYTTNAPVVVPKSSDFQNQSFTVSPRSYYASYGSFSPNVTLHITFTVTGGSVNFLVMDNINYAKFYVGSKPYEYYSQPTSYGVTRMDLDWSPPSDQQIYFIWDNSGSLLTSRSVSAYLYATWTEVENRTTTEYRSASYGAAALGAVLLLGGLGIAAYGLVSKPLSPEKRLPPPPLGSAKRFCTNCGSQIPVSAKYCPKCGQSQA